MERTAAINTVEKHEAGSVQAAITARLTEAFSPTALRVNNESSMHAVPPGSESHFRVVIVSDEFAGKSPVARHRAVHGALAEVFAGGLHALAIEARTPDEWNALNGRTSESPPCLGGSKAAG